MKWNTRRMRIFLITSKEESVCPCCGSPLKYRDSRRRVQRKAGGRKEWCLIRRLRCRGDNYYTIELGQAFIDDQSHVIPENTERYHHERTVAYKRCIKFVESYLAAGIVDWTPALHCAAFPIESDELRTSFSKFVSELTGRELKANTIDGYRRFTYYFVEYLEGKGYKSLADVKRGDVVAFVSVICSERYQAASLGAHMPGLKLFLSMFGETEPFLPEIPGHLPKSVISLKYTVMMSTTGFLPILIVQKPCRFEIRR